MKSSQALARAVSLTAFLFGLLVWIYVVLIQVTHPDWIYAPFSHVHVFPFNWRLDDVGMTGFGMAAIGFLLWQFLLHRKAR